MNLRPRTFLRIFSALTAVFFIGSSAWAVKFETEVESGLIQQKSISTEHFRIEFSVLMQQQEDADDSGLADIIEVVADAAEASYTSVIEEMGYDSPLEGTGRKQMILLDDSDEYLVPGAVGVTSLLTNGDPYMAVDPWVSEALLQVTIAHEYFHTIQFGFDPDFPGTDQGLNWAEATAVWTEEEVYSEVNDYISYLPDFFANPDYSVFASILPDDSLFQYALAIWPIFLSEYASDEIIQEIWEKYTENSVYESDLKIYNAVKDSLEEENLDLEEAYQTFSLWNLDRALYADGSSYPTPLLLKGKQETDYVSMDDQYAPALFGSNYLYFENESNNNEFFFHLKKPDGVSFSVTLIPVRKGDPQLEDAKTVLIEKEDSMTELLSISNLRVTDDVIAVVSPLEGNMKKEAGLFDLGYDYDYRAAFEDFSEDLESVEEVPAPTTTDEKAGEASTESSNVRDVDELVLKVVDYDAESVTLSWNRWVKEGLTSYRLDVEDLDAKKETSLEIEHAYTTTVKVPDLTEGHEYTFQLSALDSSGKLVGSASAVLHVTPKAWLFTDVSYFDDHYSSIASLVERGVFEGYSDGSFGQEESINRAELLKILIESRGIEVDPSLYGGCFTDVAYEWYAKYVCYAKTQGWVKGYSDGSFKASQSVNKVEALKMLFEVNGQHLSERPVASLKYGDLDPSAWYSVYVLEATNLGILEELLAQDFSPSEARNRGDMAEQLYRYLAQQES